jgi:hypothetical protein
MSTLALLAELTDYFPYPKLQGAGIVLLIVIIVFYIRYRRKQV